MLKKLISIIVLLGLFLLGIQSAYALETYVGVRILNLTDDPAASCVGQAGYDSQGRIRALSSILPDFPIYFELRYAGNDSLVWAGNDTNDIDYFINDTIMIPQLVDLTIGQDYRLFIDIDAIKIYLPLVDYQSFERTLHNEYWTAGRVGTGHHSEYYQYSGGNNCVYSTSSWTSQSSLFFISNTRDPSKLNHPCMTDSISHNCHTHGILGLFNSGSNSFRIYGRYNNLLNSNVGNMNIIFNFS